MADRGFVQPEPSGDDDDFGAQAEERARARLQASKEEEDFEGDEQKVAPDKGEELGSCFLALLPAPSGLLGAARYDGECHALGFFSVVHTKAMITKLAEFPLPYS